MLRRWILSGLLSHARSAPCPPYGPRLPTPHRTPTEPPLPPAPPFNHSHTHPYPSPAPGGALAIMEMDPSSPIWQRIFNNPFAYAAFKSTEPYLEVQGRCVWGRGGGGGPSTWGGWVGRRVPGLRPTTSRVRRDHGTGPPQQGSWHHDASWTSVLLRCCCCCRRPPPSPQHTLSYHRHHHTPHCARPQEYVSLDLASAIKDAGFEAPRQKSNTPRHRTVVAVKRA